MRNIFFLITAFEKDNRTAQHFTFRLTVLVVFIETEFLLIYC